MARRSKMKHYGKRDREQRALEAVQDLMAEGLLIQEILAGVIAVVDAMDAPHTDTDLIDDAVINLKRASRQIDEAELNEKMGE
jgi:hypothetical protein